MTEETNPGQTPKEESFLDKAKKFVDKAEDFIEDKAEDLLEKAKSAGKTIIEKADDIAGELNQKIMGKPGGEPPASTTPPPPTPETPKDPKA